MNDRPSSMLNRIVPYKLASPALRNVKYFDWNSLIGAVGQWKNANFSMKKPSSESTR
jgi:hypothetical protein